MFNSYLLCTIILRFSNGSLNAVVIQAFTKYPSIINIIAMSKM